MLQLLVSSEPNVVGGVSKRLGGRSQSSAGLQRSRQIKSTRECRAHIYNHVCAGSLVLWCRYLVLEDKQPKKNFIKQNMQSKMKWSSLSVYQFLLADVGLGAKSKSSGQIIRNRSNISNCNSWGFAILYIVSSRYLLSPRTRSINASCSWTAELSWCRGDAASQSESSKVQ